MLTQIILNVFMDCRQILIILFHFNYFFVHTGWNDKIVVLKKTTLQLYFKTFVEKINSGNLMM